MQLSELNDYRKTGYPPRYFASVLVRMAVTVPDKWNDIINRLSMRRLGSKSQRNNKNSDTNRFPGFDYAADTLSAYAESQEFFIICHENLNITCVEPANRDAFREWLQSNGVRDINGPDWIKCRYPVKRGRKG